jgi:protein-S-isoprenylcysteine O-methyltransferase Ste14
MQPGNLALRFCLQTGVWLVVMTVLVLGGAGSWRWPQGWIFLGIFAVGSGVFGVWLLKRDPALLASRLGSFSQPGQPLWDKLFLLFFMTLWLGWLWLMGRDAQVWHLSNLPLWLNIVGGLMLTAGFFAVARVFQENSFAAPVIRVQSERAQQVIDTGPYAWVRHPMYAGALLYMFGTPLLLGSWLGLAVAGLMVIGLARRAVLEEQMLRRDLAGYDQYMARVRFRLIPGIW